jgi:outer membrane lipoprotein LolB
MRALLACLVLLSLAACHTLARAPTPASTAISPWIERRAALQAIDDFQFNGQLAAATATEGFSASIRWQQQGAASDVLLRAPLGVGGAHIVLADGALRITGSDGSQLQGESARAELVRLLGFEPPLASLRYWLLGAPDPRQPDAIEMLDDSQRLTRLQQGDWQVDYAEYMQSGDRTLPRRIAVQRGALRLKLRVSNWRLP